MPFGGSESSSLAGLKAECSLVEGMNVSAVDMNGDSWHPKSAVLDSSAWSGHYREGLDRCQ